MPTYGSITFTATWDELHSSEQQPLEPLDFIDYTKPPPASWKVVGSQVYPPVIHSKSRDIPLPKPFKIVAWDEVHPDPTQPPLFSPSSKAPTPVFPGTPRSLAYTLEIFDHLSVETIATIERVLSDPVTYPAGAFPRVILLTDANERTWVTCPLGIPMLLDGQHPGDYAVSRTFMPHGGLFGLWAAHGDHTDLPGVEIRPLASRFIGAWDGLEIDRVGLATHLQSRLAVLRA